MRAIAFGVAVAVGAGPALAQPVLDAQAIAGAGIGARIETMVAGGGLTRAGIREAIGEALSGGLDADERDLLLEIADAKTVTLTIGSSASSGVRAISVPPAADDVVMLARLVTAPPNLHQLWCVGGLPAEQFVELSRFSPATFQRLYTFVGNQLDDAWTKSTLINAFSPYVTALGCAWTAMETLPADAATRTAAYDLLSTGVAYGIEKAKAANRTPPQDFLFAWMATEETRLDFITGKPKMP